MTFKDRPGSEPDVAYTYDNRGLQLSASFSSTGESVASAWDGFGRIASSTTTRGGFAVAYSFQHDADGNRISIAHPDGPAFAYDRDGLGRVSAIRHGGATLIAFAYDAMSICAKELREDYRGAPWKDRESPAMDEEGKCVGPRRRRSCQTRLAAHDRQSLGTKRYC